MGDEDRSVPQSVPQSVPCCPGVPASSSECYFCGGKVYVLERIGAEGKFFHRSCFCCCQCGATLRLGGYSFTPETGRFYCELHSEEPELLNYSQPPAQSSRDQDVGRGGVASTDDVTPSPSEEDWEHTLDSREPCDPPPEPCDPAPEPCDPAPEPCDTPPEPCETPLEPCDTPPEPSCDAAGGSGPPEEVPVPKPRGSRPTSPKLHPPVAKPRSVLLFKVLTPDEPGVPEQEPEPEPGPGPRPPLRKLVLSAAERNQLGNLQSFVVDSDPETPGGSSSSAPLGPPREQRNRRCFRRKEAPPPGAPGSSGAPRVRSKFSPWNLSSPRITREDKLSIHETPFRHAHRASEWGGDNEDDEDEDDEEDDEDDEEDEEDMFGGDAVDLEEQEDLLSHHPGKLGTKTPDARTLEKAKTLDLRKTRTPGLRKTRTLELRKERTLERRARMSQIQRFHQAQSIQRRLEEIEVTFKDLEVKGVALERTLRGENGGGGSPDLIEGFISLVHQKNSLLSEESELMVASRQLELEDQQSVLELQLRHYMEMEDKSPSQLCEEQEVLLQMLSVVDLRDSLVSFLEEKRLKELSQEQEADAIREARRHSNATPTTPWV